MEWLYIGIGAAVAVVALICGVFLGMARRKRIAEAAIGSAEEQARKILEDALKSAETKKKEALLNKMVLWK